MHINKQEYIFLILISPLSGCKENIFVHAEHSDIKALLDRICGYLEY